jgi:ACT domain-containing protein
MTGCAVTPTCEGDHLLSVDLAHSLDRLSADARGELLRVLTSQAHVRADVIRQFHERGASDMVELLILCEEDDFKRASMIQALRSLQA